jgi:hypothetical protein
MPAGKAQRLSEILGSILVSILTQVFIILDILALLVMLMLVGPLRQEGCTAPRRRQRHGEMARDSAHAVADRWTRIGTYGGLRPGCTRQAMLLMCSSQIV